MKVLIVDDHPLMLMIVREVVLKQFPSAEVVLAHSLRAAVEKASVPTAPDLVVLDLCLPDSGGPETVVRFRTVHPHTQVVVLSADQDCATVEGSRKAGARGYLAKTAGPDEIAMALRTVANGGTSLPPKPCPAPRANADLTQRQLEVLRLIAKGLANKDIARSLSIAENTVKGHARDAYLLLGVSSRVQAVRAMERLGIQVD